MADDDDDDDDGGGDDDSTAESKQPKTGWVESMNYDEIKTDTAETGLYEYFHDENYRWEQTNEISSAWPIRYLLYHSQATASSWEF